MERTPNEAPAPSPQEVIATLADKLPLTGPSPERVELQAVNPYSYVARIYFERGGEFDAYGLEFERAEQPQ
jgi:hypothetical protein